MTCIVGFVEPSGRVVVGGDSAGVAGLDIRVRADEKVFRRGPFLLGFTTSFRMGQLLRYSLQVPDQGEESDYEYLVTRFVDAVRKCLKDGGYATKTSDQEAGGTFLLGYRGRLYTVDSDYQVAAHHDPYTAVGCGADFALGALAVLRPKKEFATDLGPVFDIPGEVPVKKALEVAEKFSAGVRGPFTILAMNS